MTANLKAFQTQNDGKELIILLDNGMAISIANDEDGRTVVGINKKGHCRPRVMYKAIEGQGEAAFGAVKIRFTPLEDM